MRKLGFTLAEVLITIAILGVVATMTIPTLVSKFQEKGWNTAATVFEGRLKESLTDMYSQRALTGYSSTKDFVIALSKHLKITKICANSDLLSCFEDTVYWGDEKIDMSEIKTASHFGLDDWGTELIGIQLANGINGLIAYNPNCDTTSDNITVESCLALLYDTSGYAKPNSLSKDLRSINLSQLANNDIPTTSMACTNYWTWEPEAECVASSFDVAIADISSAGMSMDDALQACEDAGMRLPTVSEMTTICYAYKSGAISGLTSADYWAYSNKTASSTYQATVHNVNVPGCNQGLADRTSTARHVRCVK